MEDTWKTLWRTHGGHPGRQMEDQHEDGMKTEGRRMDDTDFFWPQNGLEAKLEINIAAENTINQTYRRGAISITKQEQPHTLEMYFNNSSSRF